MKLQDRVSKLESISPSIAPKQVRAWIQDLDGTVRRRDTDEVMSPEEWAAYEAESDALNIVRVLVAPPKRPTVSAPGLTQ